MKVCIVGASGKLGRYMVRHALDRGYEVVAVCREQSVGKLGRFEDRISIVPGATDDRDVIRRAVAGCDGVLTVLVPWGVQQYATGTAQAVLDHAEPDARVVFSCGWHITRDGKDVYPTRLKLFVALFGKLARLFRFADLDDQVEACRRVFASDRRWTVVRGSDLEEGESQGLPVWSRHVGDPLLASNLTRRIDFALFMVEALEDDALVREAPAIVGCRTPSALAWALNPSPDGETVVTEAVHRDVKGTQRLARVTGLLYLVVFALGMFAPIVLEQLVAPGDAAGTAANLLGSPGLFRSSLVSWVVIVAVDVAMAAMFYLLLEPAGRALSLVSASFRFAYAAILGTFLLNLYEAFMLLTHPEHAAYLEAVERQALALSALETFSVGFLLALVFFGVHLASLGVLLRRSKYVPAVLGWVLAAAGVGYVLHGLASFFVPAYGGAATAVLLTPAVIGELGLALWLVLKGVRIGDVPAGGAHDIL